MNVAEADRAPRWRRALAMTLVVVASIAAPLTIVSGFVRNQVLDTDRWVSTVSPLAESPIIQERVAFRTSEYLTEQADVDQYLAGLLPESLPPAFATAVSAAVETAIVSVTERFVASDAFATVWKEANRIGHATVRAALTGDTGDLPIETTGGRIVVDLRPVAQEVISRLQARGLPFVESIQLPEGESRLQFVVAEAEQLEQAQDAVDLLQTVAWVLFVVFLVATILALAFSVDRWRTLWQLGIGFMVAAIVLGVALIFGQSYLLDQLPENASEEAAREVYTITLRNLRRADQILFALGLAAAVGGWLARAWRSRDWVSTASLRLAGLAVAGILLLWPDNVSLGTAVWILVGLVGYEVVVGFLSKRLGSERVPPLAPSDAA